MSIQSALKNKRVIYVTIFCCLLAVEVCIALFVHDAFVRPYGGDILVTILLCCLVRAIVLKKIPFLPFCVFVFAVAVECAQALGVASLIPESFVLLRIVVGSTFSAADLVCYALGCFFFSAAEVIFRRICGRNDVEARKN